MADDILDSFLDEDLDEDMPVVVGGQRRLMQGGQIVDAPKAPIVPKSSQQTTVTEDDKPTEDEQSKVSDLDLAGQYAEDEQEILLEEKNAVTEHIESQEFSDTDKLMNDLTRAAESASGVGFANDENIRRRFHLVVEAYFKDLRDALETKSKLTMLAVSGGLGLNEKQAEIVMSVLKTKRKEFETLLTDRTTKEKKEFVAIAADKQLHGQDRAEQSDKDQLDQRYMERTGSGPEIIVSDKPSTPASPPTKIVKVEGVKKPSEASVSPAVNQTQKIDSQKPHVEDEDLANVLKAFFEQDEEKEKGREQRAESRKEKLDTSGQQNSKQEPIVVAGLPTYADQIKDPSAEKSAMSETKPVGMPPENLPVAEVIKQPEKPVVAPAPIVPPTPPKPPAIKEPLMESYAQPPAKKPVSSAMPPAAAPATPKPQFPKPPAIPARPAATAAPQPKPVMPTAPKQASPLVPINASAKPVVSDVRMSPKLLGPVEELKSITLKDFRRLSKEPKEATLKIKDKIDLLGEEQSFEIKTEGIKAWRESPINKLYLEVLRRSLEGIPIANVMIKMEEAGEDTLDKSEFDAIMKLNREIRFG